MEANEKIEDFYQNGTLYIAPELSQKGYYWTNFRYCNINAFTNVNTNNFTLTTRLKNSSWEGGLSAYDVSLYIYTDQGKSLGASMMGESWGVPWIHMWVGNDRADGLSQLVLDFDSYRNITYVVKDGNFTIYSDDTKLYTLPFSEKLGKIVGINVTFKGSGRLDSIHLYNGNNELIYREEFDELPSL